MKNWGSALSQAWQAFQKFIQPELISPLAPPEFTGRKETPTPTPTRMSMEEAVEHMKRGGWREVGQPTPTVTPTPTPPARPAPAVSPGTPFLGFPTPEKGAATIMPLAQSAEERRAGEVGKEPVHGLASALAGIFGQESSFGTDIGAMKRQYGDVGPFQISEVFTKPGQGAHGLYIPSEERRQFMPSFEFADEAISTYYRVNRKKGMEPQEALNEAIIQWNGQRVYLELVQKRLDYLRKLGMIE